jgi:hypothetical protein
MKNPYLLIMILALLASCAPQSVVTTSPSQQMIDAYFQFQNKEIEKINMGDIAQINLILTNFRTYVAQKGNSRLAIMTEEAKEARQENPTDYVYQAVLDEYSTIIISKSEPDNAYNFIQMRDDDLTVKYPVYQTMIKFYDRGLIEITTGYDVKKLNKSGQWIYILVDTKTGGIIKYQKKEIDFEPKKFELKKTGELTITPEDFTLKQLLAEAVPEFYSVLESLEDVQSTINGNVAKKK